MRLAATSPWRPAATRAEQGGQPKGFAEERHGKDFRRRLLGKGKQTGRRREGVAPGQIALTETMSMGSIRPPASNSTVSPASASSSALASGAV